MSDSTTRVTVELNEQTMRMLRSQVEGSERSLDEVVQAAIVAYIRNLSVLPEVASPAQERRSRIRQEAAAWHALPLEERRRFGDVFVAVHGGKVIDIDQERLALLKRVRRQYANEPVLITPADADAPREFVRLGLRPNCVGA